jgi:tetratricopeptide (TPR) repeat protein
LHNLSYVLRDTGKLKESLKCSRKALWLAETTGSRRVRAAVLQRRGGLYEYLGVFEGAMTSFEEAERIQKDIGDRFFRSACLADIGWEQTRRKEFTSAQSVFGEAIRIRKDTGSPSARLWLRYALIFIEKPQYEPESCPPLHEPVKASPDRTKELATADKYLKEASGLVQKDNVEDQLLLGYVKAKVLLETDPKNSAYQFGKLKEQAKLLGVGKYSFLASTCSGLANERQKRLDEAKKAYMEAEAYIVEIERELPADDVTNFRQGEQILSIKNDLASEGFKKINLG